MGFSSGKYSRIIFEIRIALKVLSNIHTAGKTNDELKFLNNEVDAICHETMFYLLVYKYNSGEATVPNI